MMHGYIPCSSLYCLNASTEWVCSIPVCAGHLEDIRVRYTTVERVGRPWPSIVYYVTWPGYNVVKIGVTTRTQVRLNELRRYGLEGVPEVLVAEPGDHVVERRRHRQFRDLRQRGSDGERTELFELDGDLLRHIADLKRSWPSWRTLARI